MARTDGSFTTAVSNLFLQIWGDFLFILRLVYCVYSLESLQRGDSNENTQHTFMFKKIKKMSVLCLLAWRYDSHSLARTTPFSNGSEGVRAIEVLLYLFTKDQTSSKHNLSSQSEPRSAVSISPNSRARGLGFDIRSGHLLPFLFR